MENKEDIPIFNSVDIVKPVYNFFSLKIGEDSVIDKAIEYLENLSKSDSFELKRSYLWIDDKINVSTVNHSILYGIDKFELLGECENGVIDDEKTPYAKWIIAQGNYIISVLKVSKLEDPAIQHWLNYEDFINQLILIRKGCSILCEIYALKGLDFFLYHYMGGETTAMEDKAMFDTARQLIKSHKTLGLNEEANFIENELIKRESNLKDIEKKFEGFKDQSDNLSVILDQLRVNAERFWNEYLSNETWIALTQSSKRNLIDSFVTENLIRERVLKTWSSTILSLAKVIEQELSISLFNQFSEKIHTSDFISPSGKSKTQLKRINKRKTTFDMLKRCTNEPKHNPTLGQLIFIGKYWNDSIMDECTNLFKECREELNKRSPEANVEINNIVSLIEKYKSDEEKPANIIDLRNASAHPGKENEYDWKNYLSWMKEAIGKPPAMILTKIIKHTRL